MQPPPSALALGGDRLVAVARGQPFLPCHHRFKNGQDHCDWSIAEKGRTARGAWVQRHRLYLGGVNDSQRAAWTKPIEVFDPVAQRTQELALYPASRPIPEPAAACGAQVRLDALELRRPRQWGACWGADRLGRQLGGGRRSGGSGCRYPGRGRTGDTGCRRW